jgi:uncharacterized protein
VDRLFLDANVLFSAAYRNDAGVARLWELAGTTLHSSEYAIEEARRNLSEAAQMGRLDMLLRDVQRVRAGTLHPDLRPRVALPEKDWPIVAGALAARATHLITGDLQHFGTYFGSRLSGILVLPPSAYLRARSRT